MATVLALARLAEAASSSSPDATCTRLWMPLTSKMLNSLPPSIPLPVSKFESTMKPRIPASSSDSPASRQYHCAGVRRRSVRSVLVVPRPPAACAPDAIRFSLEVDVTGYPVHSFAGHEGSDHCLQLHRSVSGASRMRSTRAGTPPTTAFAGTALVTTVLVPTMALSPTVAPRR